MTAKKIIYVICLLILLPLCVYSQDPARAPKRRVILPSGDTIVTSSKGGGSLLSRDDMRFFKRDTSSLDMLVDSLYNLNSKYNSLEDAASQVSGMLSEIGDEQEKSKENQSLSFRLSQQNRGRIQKEKEAQNMWEKMKKEEKLSAEDMVELYQKFGDKPTYYINGVEVDEAATNHIRPADILSRQFKVTNTVSKNPNGEIWFEVPIPVAQKVMGDINNAPKTRTVSVPAPKQREDDEDASTTKSVRDIKKKRTEKYEDKPEEVNKPKEEKRQQQKRPQQQKKRENSKSSFTDKDREKILQEALELLKDQ